MCPRIRSESKTVPVRFIIEEGQRVMLAGGKIGEIARFQSEGQKTDLVEEQGWHREQRR